MSIYIDWPSWRFSPAAPQWGWGWNCCCACPFVYVFGGESVSVLLNDNNIFDTSGNSHTAGADMPTPDRKEGEAGDISPAMYAFGGHDNSGNEFMDTDEYTPAPTDAWVSKSDFPTPARRHRGRHSTISAVRPLPRCSTTIHMSSIPGPA